MPPPPPPPPSPGMQNPNRHCPPFEQSLDDLHWPPPPVGMHRPNKHCEPDAQPWPPPHWVIDGKQVRPPSGTQHWPRMHNVSGGQMPPVLPHVVGGGTHSGPLPPPPKGAQHLPLTHWRMEGHAAPPPQPGGAT